MTHSPHESDDLPRAILERLAARDRAVPMVTPRTDEAVLSLAREQFSARAATEHGRNGAAALGGERVRRGSRRTRRWALPAAVAATLLLAVSTLVLLGPGRDARVMTPRLADDIDGSGRIDILDVLALARDVGTGEIDQARVDALAARIVALTPAERAL